MLVIYYKYHNYSYYSKLLSFLYCHLIKLTSHIPGLWARPIYCLPPWFAISLHPHPFPLIT